MSLGGVPQSTADSAGANYGRNLSAGSNVGAVAAGSGVRAGSIGSDGLGDPELGLFSDSFGFPMEGFSFDGVLSAVATGSHFTPGSGGVIGQLQQNHIHNQQQIMQQQPSPSSGSPHQPQVQHQQSQQLSRQQQLQQQTREQAAVAHQQSANVSAKLAATAAGQLPQSTLSRTKQLNKVAGPSGGAIVGGTTPNPGPTSSPVGPSALSVNTNQLRRPTAPSIRRVTGSAVAQQQQQQKQQQMMNTQAGGAGNGVPQLTLDDIAVRGANFPDIPRILPHERV